MVGVEGLVRWKRRPAGELRPDDFIPVAETSGLIDALGQFVLRRACYDLHPLSELKLSVNISPAQFRDPEFEDKVAGVLNETCFPASRLQLEVTETYVLENPDRAKSAIANLKALGIAIALDDLALDIPVLGICGDLISMPSKLINLWLDWWIMTIRLRHWLAERYVLPVR